MTEPQLVQLASGDTLFREGEPGETAFLIESGLIDVLRTVNGEVLRLATLGQGELLGEMSLIDRLPRTATAVAAAETRLRAITRTHYDQHYREANPLIRLVLRALLQRHRSSVGHSPRGETPSETMQMDRNELLARLRMEQDLRGALERRELVLHFQPIVRVADRRTAGFEALIRWNSPQRGMVPPGDFIPIAEESDLIIDIGRWVLQESCAALARLRSIQKRASSSDPLFLTLNVSGRQFESGLLYDDVASALAPGLDGGRVKLEITESLLMKDVKAGTELVHRLKALGAQLAVDDFGTGYSSLNYLHRLNADCLKVDRSFVKDLETDQSSPRVLQAIKGLATGFGLETVVEGVETAYQRDKIGLIGFDYIQGFLYSKAVPEEQTSAMIDRRLN